MKIFLDKNNYIEIKNKENEVSFSIKVRKDKTSSILVTAMINSEQLDKIIARLVAAKVEM